MPHLSHAWMGIIRQVCTSVDMQGALKPLTSNTSSSRVLSSLIPTCAIFQCSSQSWPTQSSLTSTFKTIFLCSPGVCSGFSSLRSLPVIISNYIKLQWEEERNPPCSAFPQLPIPKAVMLGQLTPAPFFALAQMLMESVLEGPGSVIANSFSHISHTGCVALFRPQWDWFSSLKTPQNNKKTPPNTTVSLGKSPQHAAYRASFIFLTHTHPSFTTQTRSWEEVLPSPWKSEWKSGGVPLLSRSLGTLAGSRGGGTAEEEEEGAAEAGLTSTAVIFASLPGDLP